MRSCISDYAVRISDVACSGSNAVAPATPATVTAVTTVYRSRLSASRKDLLIHVTWLRSLNGPALSEVAVYHAGAGATRLLHGRKGSATFTAGNCVVGVFWNYTSARYGAGPDPVSGFYVAVVADAEFVLLLGDMSRGYVDRLHAGIPIAGSPRMARQRERFVGCGCWSTKARFSESGAEHEIGVALLAAETDAEEASVTVDGRKVVQLRRLRLNFRGTHTLFLDGGAPVDMTWDLHGWLFDDPSASSGAVFTFHARGASETPILSCWTDHDDYGQRQPSGQGFCLVIQGFRT